MNAAIIIPVYNHEQKIAGVIRLGAGAGAAGFLWLMMVQLTGQRKLYQGQ